jgi:hypothetical protein
MRRLFEKIYSAAQPGAVYTPLVVSGNYTVTTASEIAAAGGFGFGTAQTEAPNGPGGGGGGGG